MNGSRERATPPDRKIGERKRASSCAVLCQRTVITYSRLNSEEWLSNRLTPSALVASPRNESPGSRPSTEAAKYRTPQEHDSPDSPRS